MSRTRAVSVRACSAVARLAGRLVDRPAHFVAAYGAAANTAFNCSIAKPCRSFSDAIGVTSAQGEVVVFDSAGYGPVTITQSVSIIAPTGRGHSAATASAFGCAGRTAVTAIGFCANSTTVLRGFTR
jgi:hypothetical protein